MNSIQEIIRVRKALQFSEGALRAAADAHEHFRHIAAGMVQETIWLRRRDDYARVERMKDEAKRIKDEANAAAAKKLHDARCWALSYAR